MTNLKLSSLMCVYTSLKLKYKSKRRYLVSPLTKLSYKIYYLNYYFVNCEM